MKSTLFRLTLTAILSIHGANHVVMVKSIAKINLESVLVKLSKTS